MRTTLTLDDELIATAKEISGLNKTSQVVNRALDEYVRRESQLRLARLAGSYQDSEIGAPSRRRVS
jgi:Arc/MetJ family transcription regulator